MTAKNLRIKSVRRTLASNETEEILLEPGVNVIVGLKDTGKTGWLNTISFLLGDTDGAEKALGPGLASKFSSASLVLCIGGDKEVLLERRWKEHGSKHKVFIDGEACLSADFSAWMQDTLGIPIVHAPKGNPFSGATWPELSWRMLFRHVYREERFWNDIADKQPDREQHSCLLQFLGVADKLYPNELGEEIRQREVLTRLRARKEQFEEVLQQAAKGLLSDTSVSNSLTQESISRAIERLKAEIVVQLAIRDVLISSAISAQGEGHPDRPHETLDLSEKRLRLVIEREQVDKELVITGSRLKELADYKVTVSAELTRLTRVEVAADIFKPLTVTRCPHCDQKVALEAAPPGACFVCHQGLPEELLNGWSGTKRRLAFEHEQLEGEDEELVELAQRIEEQNRALLTRLQTLDEEIARVDVLLRPARSAIAALLPPRLGEVDTLVGQLEERAAQLLRLREVLGQRDDLSSAIDKAAVTVQDTATQVDAKSAAIPFEQLSDSMSEGINEYLGKLNEGDPKRWVHKPVRLQITERTIKLMVGTKPWSTVGASSCGLLLLGYHYALLKLSGRNGYNYPGLSLIDFPMTLADGASIAGKENYLVEPFVTLASDNPEVQLVIGGRAFRSLRGVNRTNLSQVWTQGEEVADADPSPDASAPEPPRQLSLGPNDDTRSDDGLG